MIFRSWKNPIKKGQIYADAAAATPLSPNVRAEMTRLLDVFGNAGGLHAEAQAAKGVVDDARERCAKAIGAHADEIIFTASGTEANNLAIFGALKKLLHKQKVHAITTAIEHASVLEPLKALQSDGLELTIVPVDSEGLIDIKNLRESLRAETALISVQMVNSEIGTVQPIHEIAKEIRHERKKRSDLAMPLYFHTDASQAPLWVDLKVEKLGIDLMTLDAQKMLGPKGAGMLFVKRGTALTPLIYGGGQEKGLRGGTENPLAAGALAVALQEAQQGVEARARSVAELRDYCWAQVQSLIPSIIWNGPKPEHRAPNNLNVSIPNLEAQMAVIALNVEGVAASTRSACDVGSEEPSEVIKAIGTSKELAGTAVRFTFLPTFTKREAEYIAQALKRVADRYRN